ncbi:MAG: UV DNA damage repair endonuclease UvsE [Nitrosopumilaceae archaeon]|nr:UV DNA damage repair endonuclease UvsE [Nitrosopumilaceae archaeon]
MKIGYACQNLELQANTNNTFRLTSYSENKIIQTIEKNLEGCSRILSFNIKNKLLFFRLGSSFIPFASHPICKFDWEKYFQAEFVKIGKEIKKNDIRISMHPGQFVVLNSKKQDVVSSSIRELEYHSRLMDLLKLDESAKIQIHVGFPHGDKEKAKMDFIRNYDRLSKSVKKRLVIENDEHYFGINDCFEIHKAVDIPILLDTFHYSILNEGKSLEEIFELASKTWKNKDGLPMIDYSSQNPEGRKGKHCSSIDINNFENTISKLIHKDFDLMVEIKDKESSALKASKSLLRMKMIFV